MRIRDNPGARLADSDVSLGTLQLAPARPRLPDMTMTIRAIETPYAGHRFRSRLEARWAVFFDSLGLEWDYEPETLNIPRSVSGMSGAFGYLPDFWLPELRLWAEVKGEWNAFEQLKMLDIAAWLSGRETGRCGEGSDVLILGSVPREHGHRVNSPWRLHMHDGELVRMPFVTDRLEPSHLGLHCDLTNKAVRIGIDRRDVFGELGEELLDGVAMWPYSPQWYRKALANARSARFEWGESGAVAA